MKIILRKDAFAQGLKKYYAGKVCRRGHIAERYVAGACVECIAELKRVLPGVENLRKGNRV